MIAKILTRIAVCLTLVTGFASAQSVVISQVYGGGGGGTAVYKADYVELFNPTGSAVNLSTYSLQYQAAASTGNWSGKVNLSGSIAAGKYFLVQMSSTSGSGASALDLPAPDLTFTTISMSASAGKVALVSNQTTLATAAGPPIVCPGSGVGIVDLVGYGSTANCSETGPITGTIDATRVLVRNGAGCTDTGSNSADFTVTQGSIASPWTPRNSASTGTTCGGGGGSQTSPSATGSASPSSLLANTSTTLSATITAGTNPASTALAVACNLSTIGGSSSAALTVAGLSASLSYLVPANTAAQVYSLPCTVSDGEARSGNFNIALTVVAPVVSKRIYEINGPGSSSPLAGTAVSTTGIVTAVRASTGSIKAFYIEALTADRDSDPATSEGIQVFIGSAALPACAVVGNQIEITGTVTDFVPSTAPAGSVPVTEITSPTICNVTSTNQLGALPSAVTINAGNPITVGGSATQVRRYLGMRVSLPSALVAGPTSGFGTEANATKTSNGQFYVTIPGVSRPLRGAGILDTRRPSDAAGTVPGWNTAPEVLRVDITALATAATTPYEVTPGMTISNLTGVVDFNTNQGQYQIFSNEAGKGTPSAATPTLSATAVPAPLATDLVIASANLERFYNDVADGNGAVTLTNTAYQGRLNKLSLSVRNVLRFPDIVTFEEVEGAGVNAASDPTTLSDIATKINNDAVAASQENPNYGYCLGRTNDPGGITVGFLFKRANSRVTLVDCVQYGTTTTYSTPGGGTSTLNDRPPLVLRATVKAANSDSGLTVRVVANHLRSLNGIDEPGAANGDRVRAKRNEQAKYTAGLIRGTVEQNSNWAANDTMVLVGDFNAFDVSDGYADLMGCIAGTPAAANTLYTTTAQNTASPVCTASTPTLTMLTSQDRTAYYSYTFAGAIQTLDHVLLSSKANARFRQLSYARVNADFADGSTYRSDFTRPERYSDHDPAVLYLKLPVEVSSRTRLNASALALNRATGRYNGTITVTNTGSAALTGPVYVFFANLPSGVTLPDLPVVNGMPMATINLPSGLAVGATSSSVAISFANPTNARISYTTTRFDGTY